MSAVVSSSTGKCGSSVVDNSGCRLRSIASFRKSSSSSKHSNNNQAVSSSQQSVDNDKRKNNNNNRDDKYNNSESTSTLSRTTGSSRSRRDSDIDIGGGAESTNLVIATNTASAAVPNGTTPSNNSIKQCCFRWCCCCPCSCLAVKAVAQEEVKVEFFSPDIMQIFDDDNMPTLEEVQIWGESFDRLMKSENGRKIFREFLRGEYSEENILFWLACEELKRETNPSIVEERARFIYEDYISILSPKEVSLDSRVREMINKTISMPRPNMFDEAQTQIYTLMHRDSYPRFVNSQVYKDLLSSASTKQALPSTTSSSSAATTAKPSSNVRKKNVSS